MDVGIGLKLKNKKKDFFSAKRVINVPFMLCRDMGKG